MERELDRIIDISDVDVVQSAAEGIKIKLDKVGSIGKSDPISGIAAVDVEFVVSAALSGCLLS